jgi:hypothetical protein
MAFLTVHQVSDRHLTNRWSSRLGGRFERRAQSRKARRRLGVVGGAAQLYVRWLLRWRMVGRVGERGMVDWAALETLVSRVRAVFVVIRRPNQEGRHWES